MIRIGSYGLWKWLFSLWSVVGLFSVRPGLGLCSGLHCLVRPGVHLVGLLVVVGLWLRLWLQPRLRLWPWMVLKI